MYLTYYVPAAPGGHLHGGGTQTAFHVQALGAGRWRNFRAAKKIHLVRRWGRPARWGPPALESRWAGPLLERRRLIGVDQHKPRPSKYIEMGWRIPGPALNCACRCQGPTKRER